MCFKIEGMSCPAAQASWLLVALACCGGMLAAVAEHTPEQMAVHQRLNRAILSWGDLSSRTYDDVAVAFRQMHSALTLKSKRLRMRAMRATIHGTAAVKPLRS